MYAKFYQNISKGSKDKIEPVSLLSEFEPWQNQKHSSQYFTSFKRWGPFSIFQKLELGKASTDVKYHFAICWARSCQYECVFKRLSIHVYSKRFKGYGHFSLFVRVQNLHKRLDDKIKYFIIWHTLKVNLQLPSTCLGACNIYDDITTSTG